MTLLKKDVNIMLPYPPKDERWGEFNFKKFKSLRVRGFY